MATSETTTQSGLILTEAAAKQIARLVAAESEPDTKVRLAVSGGGCSGFQYGFSFDSAVNEDDQVFERNGAALVVDSVSLELLAGSEVDYVEDLVGAAFQVRNPQATSSCGCGSSFSI